MSIFSGKTTITRRSRQPNFWWPYESWIYCQRFQAPNSSSMFPKGKATALLHFQHVPKRSAVAPDVLVVAHNEASASVFLLAGAFQASGKRIESGMGPCKTPHLHEGGCVLETCQNNMRHSERRPSRLGEGLKKIKEKVPAPDGSVGP